MTGAELRALRQAAGLTQRQAAERLGCSAQEVHRWERGLVPIPALKVPGIIAAMPSPSAPKALDKDVGKG